MITPASLAKCIEVAIFIIAFMCAAFVTHWCYRLAAPSMSYGARRAWQENIRVVDVTNNSVIFSTGEQATSGDLWILEVLRFPAGILLFSIAAFVLARIVELLLRRVSPATFEAFATTSIAMFLRGGGS